jgi:uncharacterized protein with PIN domain
LNARDAGSSRRASGIVVRHRSHYASLASMARAVRLIYRCRGCGREVSEFLVDRPDLRVGEVYLSPKKTIPCPGCGKVEPVLVRVVGDSVPPPSSG